MRKKIIYTLVLTAVSAATVAFSPKPLKAQILGFCPCTGGCENLLYYNHCRDGTCSWFCG